MKKIAGLLALVTLALALSAGTALAALSGTPEPDTFEGTDEGDVFRGLAGNDSLYGNGGEDVLYGAQGRDVLYGDAGRDELRGGPGDDAIHADDGARDRIACGDGRDTVLADPEDRLGPGCETRGPGKLEGGVLATFQEGDERFRVWVTNPQTVEYLRRLQKGEETARTITGRLVQGPGQGNHNAPYSWHLDPQSVGAAEVTVPECHAPPSYVEENFDSFSQNSFGSYCSDGELVDLRDHAAEGDA